jgi:hypothetical protein
MSATAVPLSDLATSRRWQTNFLDVMPAVMNHARVRFRHLPACHQAEAVAETIARACVDYAGLARKRQLHRVYAGSLATFAAKAVAAGRRAGGHVNSKDVLNPVAQQRRGFSITSVSRWDRQEGDWRDMTLESRRATPADQAIFNVDFQTWLNGWSHRHRRIIIALSAGHRTMDVARKFGVSEGRVAQLRREYQDSWEQFQGIAQAAAAA